ncbi:MAG: carbonic anhydrase, partial [Bradymonadaceae bacterium]
GSSPGDHFTVANIGNSVRTWSDGGEPIVSGSVLYPVLETDPEAVFVVGHTDCGAVTAAYEWEQSSQAPDRDELRSELELVRRHVADGLELLDLESHDKPATLARLAEFNVDRQVATLAEAVDEVPVVGAVCDLHEQYSDRRGGVHLVNYDDATEANDVPTELATYHNRLTAP